MGFLDFIKPPPAILLGQQLGLIVSSEDLYDDAIGGFRDPAHVIPKLSGLGKEVVAFAYRPLNFPAGKYMAEWGDKAHFKKSNGLALHEEVVAIHTDSNNAKKVLFRGFHGGHGFTEDPKLINYFRENEYRLHKEVLVLKDNVNTHDLLLAMGKDSRFDEAKDYDFMKRNCQYFAKAFRDSLKKQGALKFSVTIKQ